MADKERLKSIRRGDWSIEDINSFFDEKKLYLEKLYNDSIVLPYKPDGVVIKRLLMSVLEQHFGSLDNLIKSDSSNSDLILNQIRELVK